MEKRTYHKTAKPKSWQGHKGVTRAFGESAVYSEHQGCEGLYGNRLKDLLLTLRPAQWIKNLLLAAAPFFAWFDKSQPLSLQPLGDILALLAKAIGAFILFSAAVYLLNDLHDRRKDAKHPIRKKRPIAAKRISLVAAIVMMGLCLLGGAGLTWWTGNSHFAIVCGCYLCLQPLYTFLFRQVKGLGVFILAIGFLLRALAGGVLCAVHISPWFLLCVFLVALFIALCKRRSEFPIEASARQKTLPTYSAELQVLDLEIGVSAAVVITSYALYTLSATTIHMFGTDRLIYTVPIVIFGIFHYLRLTYCQQQAGTPEYIFLRDWQMVLTFLVWVSACTVILATA